MPIDALLGLFIAIILSVCLYYLLTHTEEPNQEEWRIAAYILHEIDNRDANSISTVNIIRFCKTGDASRTDASYERIKYGIRKLAKSNDRE